MDFGEVLSKAWKITWKFKVLWIFGIFASCGTRSGGNFNGGGSSSYPTNGGAPGPAPNLPPGFASGMEQFIRLFENPAVIAVFISIICIIILLSLFLGTIGRIGLIKGALEADAGAETLTFGGLWNESLPYFWRVFGLSLLIGVPFFILALILAIGFALAILLPASGNRGGELALVGLLPILCVLLCLIFLAAIVVGFITRQAENAIVIEDEGILGGLRRGWDVLIKNLGPILLIWLILVVIGFAAGIVIALPLLVVAVPAFIAFAAIVANGSQASYTPLIVAGLCVVAYIPVSLVANGILMAYIQSVWTLTYIRLTKPRQEAQPPVVLPANA